MYTFPNKLRNLSITFMIIGFNEFIASIDTVLVDIQSYQNLYLVIKLEGFLQVSGRIVVLPVKICEVKDLG